MRALGEFESLVLFAAARLEPEAYGVSIRREIRMRTGRDVALGAVYTCLQRLERRGLVRSAMGEPTPARGGRRKKLYRVEPAGVTALARLTDTVRRMAHGLDARLRLPTPSWSRADGD